MVNESMEYHPDEGLETQAHSDALSEVYDAVDRAQNLTADNEIIIDEICEELSEKQKLYPKESDAILVRLKKVIEQIDLQVTQSAEDEELEEPDEESSDTTKKLKAILHDAQNLTEVVH